MKLLNYLVILTGVLGCSLLGAEGGGTAASAVRNVNVAEFDQMRSEKSNVVLDVRTADEYKTGHIAGAIQIDWNDPDFDKKAAALDKTKGYLLHCASGRRSAKAASKLSQLGFSKVYNLEGGIGAWKKAGKPVEK